MELWFLCLQSSRSFCLGLKCVATFSNLCKLQAPPTFDPGKWWKMAGCQICWRCREATRRGLQRSSKEKNLVVHKRLAVRKKRAVRVFFPLYSIVSCGISTPYSPQSSPSPSSNPLDSLWFWLQQNASSQSGSHSLVPSLFPSNLSVVTACQHC